MGISADHAIRGFHSVAMRLRDEGATAELMKFMGYQEFERKDGVVINVTSTVTVKPLHLLSVYTASKSAVNAFSEVLALELEPFNIRVKVVLPGRAPDTRFGDNARSRIAVAGGFPDAYADLVQSVFAGRAEQPASEITRAVDVAEAVWRAATDPSCPAFLPAGVDAVAVYGQR